jgi:hypothetical protein
LIETFEGRKGGGIVLVWLLPINLKTEETEEEEKRQEKRQKKRRREERRERRGEGGDEGEEEEASVQVFPFLLFFPSHIQSD